MVPLIVIIVWNQNARGGVIAYDYDVSTFAVFFDSSDDLDWPLLPEVEAIMPLSFSLCMAKFSPGRGKRIS